MLSEFEKKHPGLIERLSKIPPPVRRTIPLAGDIIHSATSAVGIQPCAGCRKRRAWLNKLDAAARKLLS